MLTRKPLLLYVGVVASLMVLTAIEGAATGGGNSLPSFGVETPPRECTVSLPSGLGSVTIQAGPHESGGLAETFPIPDPCPPGVGLPVGQCLKWTYRWIFPGGAVIPLEALVSVDTDITVLAATPHATVSTLLPLTAAGERFLKFNVTTNTFTASHWTPPGVGPGTLTAGFFAKKSFFPLAGRCALAGADNQIANPNLAVTTQVIDQVGDCSIQRTIDAQGCTLGIQVTSGDCTVTEAVLEIDGLGPIAVGCGTQITAEGSTRYCYPTATGKMRCVNLP